MATRRQATQNVAALLAILEAEPAELDVDVMNVNRAAAERMFVLAPGPRERLTARFIGGATANHELSARAATRAIFSLQESVSAIGAAIVGLSTTVGKLPTNILAATELHFTPRVKPGSIIFELRKPATESVVGADSVDRDLLDESFSALLDLVGLLGPAQNNTEAVPSEIRRLGPRAAKHLFDLSAVLVEEGLGLDVGWNNRSGNRRSEMLSNSAAKYLKSVAKGNTSTHEDVDLFGILLTASVEHTQKLRLRLQDGSVIALAAPPELRQNLAQFYNRRVRVGAIQTLRVSTSTGKESVSYEMRAIDLNP